MKKRLDVLLVERGLAESRAQAQALVIAGLVPGYDKPGHQLADDAELTVERPPRVVSRGGEKLVNPREQVEHEHDGPAGSVDPRAPAHAGTRTRCSASSSMCAVRAGLFQPSRMPRMAVPIVAYSR